MPSAICSPIGGELWRKGYWKVPGLAYHSDWTARVRDVWRQRILEGRGWKIHRIWSTNWWLDRDAEIRKLDARLRSCTV
jgi:REase_MTES_1575